MDLSLLQTLEREKVLQVLYRDKQLRAIEEDRIRRMKHELLELRRSATQGSVRQYGERTCARCQKQLGKLWNSGDVCRGCSHRVCKDCRVGVGAAGWQCTICHAYRKVKFRSGDWFLEQRGRKFPVTTDRYETVGEKLLKTYSVLSFISVIPPTPPAHYDYQSLSRSGDFKSTKPLALSMEDLVASFTNRLNEQISTSQDDVRGDQVKVDKSRSQLCFKYSTQKSLSDTDISKSTHLFKGPSLPNLFKKNKDSDAEGSSTGAEEETSFSSEYSGGKRGSNSSISTECSLFDGVSVTGELELALDYNTSTSCLEITVGAGRNLSCGDTKRKKCHPCVRVYLLPEKTKNCKLKTTVKKNTTDPVYNEVLKYQIDRHLLRTKRLQASVWNSGALRKKVFLGEVLIPLDGWIFEDTASHWYPLCPRQADSADEQHGGQPSVRTKFDSNFKNQDELLLLSSLKCCGRPQNEHLLDVPKFMPNVAKG